MVEHSRAHGRFETTHQSIAVFHGGEAAWRRRFSPFRQISAPGTGPALQRSLEESRSSVIEEVWMASPGS